ncbi:flagella basal body P-ring formation protein FlgA [Nitrospira sp.]|nr:flagella basal body P-ring formation protein FlgA [Nitrospira sp.]
MCGLVLVSVLGVTVPASPTGAESGAWPTHIAKVPTPTRSVQRLTPARLRQAVTAYLEERLAGRVSEVEVDVLDPTEPTILPEGRLNLEVIPGASLDQSGRRRVHVVPSVNGRPAEGLDVVIDVNLFAEAVVPMRLLKPEEVIQPEDLATSRIRISRVPHQYVTEAGEAVGKSPGRILYPQQPIRIVSLVKPYAVRKGDRVAIEARRGGLSIRAVGTTKGAGQVGSFVTVTNADSGKDIRAKVIGPGLVEVDF